MKSFEYTVTAEGGFHARPVSLFAQEAKKFVSKVYICKGEERIDTRRPIALMKLVVKKGETMRVEAEGPDEEVALKMLRRFLEENHC